MTVLEMILSVAVPMLGIGWLRAHDEAVSARAERDDAILQLRALTSSYGKRVDSRSAVR
jgi:hypothetical protein